MSGAPALEVDGLTKRFGPVTALSDVSLSAYEGEIVGLIGVNGAGKSTLMNIVDGVLAPSAGEIRLGGKPVRFANPQQARRAGIGFIHQHSTCFPELTVAENVSIQRGGAGPFRRARIEAEAAALLERLGAGHVSPRARVSDLTIGERQMVDVARVLIDDPAVLLFDEPTSSLSRSEAERLFEVVRGLREEGRTILYTSHFLDDVLDLSDRIVVLRDGAVAMDAAREGLTRESLVSTMLARDLAAGEAAYRPEPANEKVLRVEGLVPEGRAPVSFHLRRGEVLGIWGLLGAGRTEIFRALLGLDGGQGGEITLAGEDGEARRVRPRELLREVGFVTEDRHHDGLFLSLPIWQNVTAAATRRFAGRTGAMHAADERAAADEMTERLSIKLGSADDPVSSLSGGNQQKVVLGRWLVRAPRVYLFDEPTHGVDVGAKAQIPRSSSMR